MKNNVTDLQLRILEKETIDCQDVEELLGDYTDQELACTLRARMDAHIERCAYCQQMSASYLWVVELAHELKDKPVPKAVRNNLRAALNRRLGLNLSAVK